MHPHETEVEVRIGIVSVSTSRFKKYGRVEGLGSLPEDDESTKVLLEELNYAVLDYVLVGDDESEIAEAVLKLSRTCNAVITVGGTGIAPRDVTVEAVKPLIKKEIEGFGEIFRYESFREIGVHAMLSRAFAGILKNGSSVFCLPGSKNAVKLGIRLINPVLKHILSHANSM
jgi:molybdenum cofactor biosynthesis protein B